MDALKQAACDAIDAESDALCKLSQVIWENPEENFEEVFAHGTITQFLEARGFPVDKNWKLPTAFRSVLGKSDNGPHIAILCEYDALPVIGHACGHNLITESGVAAGIGIKAALEATESLQGKVTIMGTPAEEGGGGKISLIKAGAFSDIDVAMMVHPGVCNDLTPMMLARDGWTVTYKGKAAHAAAFPWEGVNALDAAVMCYTSISCLRQQIKPSWRIHSIISKGGVKPNIIPEIAELEVHVRAPTVPEMEALKQKVIECCESAAKATGCSVEFDFIEAPYAPLKNNEPLSKVFKENALVAGTEMGPVDMEAHGSTDMGDVTQIVPGIHPFFYIGAKDVNHTRQFTEDAGDARAQPFTLIQGKALAMTAIDILTKPGLIDTIKAHFAETRDTL